MSTTADTQLLDAATVAEVGRLRLALRRRVEGRFAGAHAARGYGSSLDFADHREYVEGDDPRLLDHHAYARLGRRLVKLYAAEDTAALRVVLDRSGSMAGKWRTAQQVAAVLAALAAGNGDRVRVLLAGDEVDAGPWYGGPAALPAVERRLLGASAGGPARLDRALRRAASEGPRGPVVLVSDVLDGHHEETIRLLGAVRGDALLVHVLSREELAPTVRGDARLVDVETDDEVEVAVTDDRLAAYQRRLRRWLADVEQGSRRRGVGYLRLVTDESITEFAGRALLQLGLARR